MKRGLIDLTGEDDNAPPPLKAIRTTSGPPGSSAHVVDLTGTDDSITNLTGDDEEIAQEDEPETSLGWIQEKVGRYTDCAPAII